MTIQNYTGNALQTKTIFAPHTKRQAEESEGFKEQLTQINGKSAPKSAKTGESASVDSSKKPKESKEKEKPFTFSDFLKQYTKDLKAKGYSAKEAMVAALRLSVNADVTGSRIYRYETGKRPSDFDEVWNHTIERYLHNDDPKVQKQFIAQVLREMRKDSYQSPLNYKGDPFEHRQAWEDTIKYLSDKLKEWGMSEYETMESTPIERGEMKRYIDEQIAIKNLLDNLTHAPSRWDLLFEEKKSKKGKDSQQTPKPPLETLLQSGKEEGARNKSKSIS